MKTLIYAKIDGKIVTAYEFDRRASHLRRYFKKDIRHRWPEARIYVKNFDPAKEPRPI